MTINVITRRPQNPTHPVPLLFVHGAWHSAWCWDENFLPYFAEQGFDAHALDLRGHGDSPNNKMLRLTGIWNYIADVAQVADQIEADSGKRPVIIGHSMGGYVTQKYLEKHLAPAAVLLASIPVVGTIPYQFRVMWNYPIAAVKLTLTLSAKPLVATPELTHKQFFSDDMPRDQVEKYWAKMQDESVRILLDAGFVNRPHPQKINPTPMLVLAAENDRVFTLNEQRKTAQAYGTSAEIFPNMAHDMMLEADWQSVADRIIAWLDLQTL
jgi:pimeloyl-ACP methyl ester carboxylesterase